MIALIFQLGVVCGFAAVILLSGVTKWHQQQVRDAVIRVGVALFMVSASMFYGTVMAVQMLLAQITQNGTNVPLG